MSGVFIILLLVSSNSYADKNYGCQNKINFWHTTQKGTNIFNQHISFDDIKAAKKYGIKFIRLALDKFITAHRDFLIGDADNYSGLIKEDLAKLKEVLDMCLIEKMPVVITMLSLPGSRWKQNNNMKDDLRIWTNKKYQLQAAKFWQDLARELKDHSIVVGYNILNEPHPEKLYNKEDFNVYDVNQDNVQNLLFEFYDLVIESIRVIDKNTPIILDSSAYADPKTFKKLKIHKDANILYSFHMYEPYAYTNKKLNNGRFDYPGIINEIFWDKTILRDYMDAVVQFQKQNNIQSNKILVGEFGGHRMSRGLEKYFQDLIAIFSEKGWHFAFYAFREDTWDGMDYELGHKNVPWSYWKAIENGQKPELERKDKYPAFSIIKKALYE